MGEAARSRATLAVRRGGPRSRDFQERRDRPGRAGQSARFIDEVYNRPRLHAALSYLGPQQFEHGTGRRSNQRPDRCPGQGPTPASRSPSSSLRGSGRRACRTKSDIIIDVKMLLRILMAWPGGEPQVCSMVPIPTEADEEARRTYREQEHVTGVSGGGPNPLGDHPTAAEMMYLLRRHILGRNFFLRPDCVHHVPEAVLRYHSKRFREAYEASSARP